MQLTMQLLFQIEKLSLAWSQKGTLTHTWLDSKALNLELSSGQMFGFPLV